MTGGVRIKIRIGYSDSKRGGGGGGKRARFGKSSRVRGRANLTQSKA